MNCEGRTLKQANIPQERNESLQNPAHLGNSLVILHLHTGQQFSLQNQSSCCFYLCMAWPENSLGCTERNCTERKIRNRFFRAYNMTQESRTEFEGKNETNFKPSFLRQHRAFVSAHFIAGGLVEKDDVRVSIKSFTKV